MTTAYNTSVDDLDLNYGAGGQAGTAPKTPINNENADKVLSGRVTKARASLRKIDKKNYQGMLDPFNLIEDADETGERIFKVEKSESEESNPNDVEFGKVRKFGRLFPADMESL